MRCADVLRLFLAAVLATTLAACGGGNSSVTTTTGGGINGGGGGSTVTLDTPTGDNTTEIVVDGGPATGFSLGVANVPYVTVTVCTPGSATDCVTIDHVFLDTGSIGLRVLKSAVAKLSLPAVTIPGGTAVECYPFVLGGVWGPLAKADLRVAGELASNLPMQLIDDGSPAAYTAPADCISSSNGGLLNSVASLQANGILGVGMVSYDCGSVCASGNYTSGHILYYACSGATSCAAGAIPVASQMQNPVAKFAVNNNGTVIHLPAVPDLGAGVAKGRLVFGIGTQANNQIPPSAQMIFVDPDPTHIDTYLYFTVTVNGTAYPGSYLDSGSNAYFFDDASLTKGCQSSAGSTTGGWYCPASVVRRTATFSDVLGNSTTADFAIANADALFNTTSNAFADLGGAVGQGSATFVGGLPFFFGRPVFTSIWGQALSPNGPWNAF